jgi:hypothetical protein
VEQLAEFAASHDRSGTVPAGSTIAARAAESRALGVPLSTLYRLYLGSACINEILWHGRGFAAVHRVNDTSHLP